MVTFVFKDQEQFEAYLDGDLKGVSATNSSPNTNSGDLEIARQDNEGGRFNFEGNIQHVRIYDHALTQQEINYLYQVGSRGIHTSDKRTL